MARQKGPLKVKGRIGDLSFYKSQDGYMIREKGGVTKQRIMSDPAFRRTRENFAEFGSAGMTGRMVRAAFNSVLGKSGDRLMTSRLHRLLMRVLQTDQVSERGQRNVANGDVTLLEDFDFNVRSSLGTTLYVQFAKTIDRATGELSVSIPGFVPQNKLFPPSGTTHYQFVLAGAAIDFEQGLFEIETAQTVELPYGKDPAAAVDLSVQLPPGSVHPLFLVLKIAFFQEITGSMYPLQAGSFNSATLLKVDTV